MPGVKGRPIDNKSPESLAKFAASIAARGPLCRAKRHRGQPSPCPECALDVHKKRDQARALRRRLVASLGGKCACCQEETYEFLHVDHVRGGGSAERKAGVNVGPEARRNPERFQVLCANCNLAKGFWGTCPHVYQEWT